jgi:bifunctional oligoribonuclease and PAP phosphatase NrnA
MDEALVASLAHQLRQAQRLLVVSHIHPDGDAIGSLLGIGLVLQETGKQVVMVLADGVPANFRFLTGVDQVVTSPHGDFDAIIAVDCSDVGRFGNALADYGLPDVNIDHHITNNKFARINLVDNQSVATAEILAVLLPSAGFPLNQNSARALLTGLVTDTLGFRTANVTPETLRTAARLLEFGIDLPEIFQNTLVQRSFEAVRYWASGLNRIERCGGLAWTSLTLEDRKAVGYPGQDDADLINVLSSITNIDIAIIFIEQVRGRIKVSWRARPGLDVSKVALNFGGGGHPAAAGAEIHGVLSEVRESVLKATQMIMNN